MLSLLGGPEPPSHYFLDTQPVAPREPELEGLFFMGMVQTYDLQKRILNRKEIANKAENKHPHYRFIEKFFYTLQK